MYRDDEHWRNTEETKGNKTSKWIRIFRQRVLSALRFIWYFWFSWMKQIQLERVPASCTKPNSSCTHPSYHKVQGVKHFTDRHRGKSVFNCWMDCLLQRCWFRASNGSIFQCAENPIATAVFLYVFYEYMLSSFNLEQSQWLIILQKTSKVLLSKPLLEFICTTALPQQNNTYRQAPYAWYVNCDI